MVLSVGAECTRDSRPRGLLGQCRPQPPQMEAQEEAQQEASESSRAWKLYRRKS